MGLRDILGGALGSAAKLPWMPSRTAPARLPPVQLPRDERPHDRSLEWWHFMGHFRLLHQDVKDVGADSTEAQSAGDYDKRPTSSDGPGKSPAPAPEQDPGPLMSFVLSILKARVGGVTKLASFVILIDHQRQTHTVSTQLGALGGVYFEPTDGSAFNFHFGAPGPARPGPPEAWSAEGGMGIYRLTIDTSRQITLDLSQRSPAILVGERPRDEDELRSHGGDDHTDDEARAEKPAAAMLRENSRRCAAQDDHRADRARAEKPAVTMLHDGVMRYAGQDEMAYYAFPALVLDGILGVGGQEQTVIGRAWMEHQWGDFPLGDYQWKYLAIDLVKDGDTKHAQLLVFSARKRAQKTFHVHAVWIQADGHHVVLDKRYLELEDVSDGDFEGYPVTTRLRYRARPGEDESQRLIDVPELHLTITPIFEDQRCRTDLPEAIFPAFWEGACTIDGSMDGKSVSQGSWAITELAGYE